MKIFSVVVMSLLLVISLGGPAFAAAPEAVSDGDPGDECVDTKDLQKAHVVVFPTVAATLPEFASVGIRMVGGSTLPGMISIDFDVDGNTATGDKSVLAMSNCMYHSDQGGCASGSVGGCGTGASNPTDPCGSHGDCPPNPGGFCDNPAPVPAVCKNYAGFDFWVNILLRDNGPDATTQMCSAGACALKGESCGVVEDCFFTDGGCQPGADNCYLMGEKCGEEGPNSCYVMDTLCPPPCSGKGRVRGEWYAGFGQSGNIDRGRIEMPLPGETHEDTETCFVLPWGRIVQAAFDQGLITQTTLDLAKNYPPKYNLAVWYDSDFTDEDDFFDFDPIFALDLADWIPNGSLTVADANEGSTPCAGDLDNDGAVTVNDTSAYLNDLPRNNYSDPEGDPPRWPCPTCNFGLF